MKLIIIMLVVSLIVGFIYSYFAGKSSDEDVESKYLNGEISENKLYKIQDDQMAMKVLNFLISSAVTFILMSVVVLIIKLIK